MTVDGLEYRRSVAPQPVAPSDSFEIRLSVTNIGSVTAASVGDLDCAVRRLLAGPPDAVLL